MQYCSIKSKHWLSNWVQLKLGFEFWLFCQTVQIVCPSSIQTLSVFGCRVLGFTQWVKGRGHLGRSYIHHNNNLFFSVQLIILQRGKKINSMSPEKVFFFFFFKYHFQVHLISFFSWGHSQSPYKVVILVVLSQES